MSAAPPAIDPLADCPRLLADFPPAPGRFKVRPEDFVVEERPLYPASGAGTHVYFQIEKRGLTTHEAIHRLAAALGRLRREFGCAGLKDARAVTRQWLSLEHVDPDRVAQLEVAGVRMLQVTRHGNKLKLGHLAGNDFQLRIRDVPAERVDALRTAVERLVAQGVPNYFGPQRFGLRGDGWRIGRAIVRGDRAAAVDLLLGTARPEDPPQQRAPRTAYDAGDFPAALRAWPKSFREERRALATLARTGRKTRAFAAIDRHTRGFLVNAYQSWLFNQVLADRLRAGTLHQVQSGDLAWLHDRGAVFLVEDPAGEQPRCAALEISPSGPLFGYRMSQPEGPPRAAEQRVLEDDDVSLDAFHTKYLRVKGGRRPLRFPLGACDLSLGADEAGPYLQLKFNLPRGCYATMVLRELFRDAGGVAGSLDEE